MISDLGLQDQRLVEDYEQWDAYYNHMLTKFYVEKVAKQCVHFGKEFPRNVDWTSLHTDKFVLTEQKTIATMGVNFSATHFVEDTYYNISKYIFNNKIYADKLQEYLVQHKRSKIKPFAMQYLIGAIEAKNKTTFEACYNKIKQIEWSESNW
jgi:hypothetical protein